MLDHRTTPELADAVKSGKLDAPAGADILRIEPILEAADFERQPWIVVAFVVYWPNGDEWAGSAMLRTGGAKTPGYQVRATRSMEGAKIVARAYALDGAIKLGVRLSVGTEEDLPPKLELPTKGK